MIRTAACAAALLLLVCETAARPRQQLSLSESLVTSNGTRAVYSIVDGVPHWRLLPHLWVDKAVRLLWDQGKVEAFISICPSLSTSSKMHLCKRM